MTPQHRLRTAGAISTSAALALVGLATTAPLANAVDTTSPVVISEIYGGGGNSGAPFTNDFIELYNSGSTAVDLTGWSVQYTSATGSSWTNKTTLTGSIAPGGYYLIQQGAGTTVTDKPLPTPNVSGTIAMSGSSGKVALVNSATALTCGLDCDSAAGVVDFVGYGTANDFAGSAAAPGTTNATSDFRSPAPGTNTGNNAADFVNGAPTPAGGATTPTEPPVDPTPGPLTIQDIQGAGFVSPIKGQAVTNVPGIVTGVRSTGTTRGFWIQQPTKDAAKPNASTGVFVFTGSSAITAKVGDSVLVSGTISDYYTLASGETLATTDSLSMTEITRPTTTVLSSGNPLPAAITLPADLPSTYSPVPTGAPSVNVETLTLDPTRSAMEWYESHEGELVSVNDARVVGPGQPQYGEIYVTSKPAEFPTQRGGTYLSSYDALPTGRILVAPVNGQVPAANVGDVLSGATTGPLDWSSYGGYDIAATALGTRIDNGLTKTVVDPATADELTVATYNVENLAPSDSAAKYASLAEGVVTNLRSPDVVTVEEIQDNSGTTDNGVVASDVTVGKLIAAIAAAGGPTYQAAWIDPVDKADGGQPGGNIRVGFLYNPDRVSFVAKPGGDATTAVTVAKDTTAGLVDTPTLSVSPGRIDPTNPAWTSSRKPLAGEFVFNGRKVIVVANHFNSKGGDESAEGRFQQPNRSSEVQRTQQALSVNAFVKQVMAVDPQANVVLAGDFNDYQFSAPMAALTDNGALLTDLITTLPAAERYSYVFNGVSQVLDHILVSRPISDAGAVRYQVAHLNAEFSVQTSDHDPQLARIKPILHLYAPGSAALAADKRKAGQLAELNLSGWSPGDVVTVTWQGTVIAKVTIAADGTGYIAYRIPADTPTGFYTMTLTGRQTTAATVKVTVLAKSKR